jgi:hypothetical protein
MRERVAKFYAPFAYRHTPSSFSFSLFSSLNIFLALLLFTFLLTCSEISAAILLLHPMTTVILRAKKADINSNNNKYVRYSVRDERPSCRHRYGKLNHRHRFLISCPSLCFAFFDAKLCFFLDRLGTIKHISCTDAFLIDRLVDCIHQRKRPRGEPVGTSM